MGTIHRLRGELGTLQRTARWVVLLAVAALAANAAAVTVIVAKHRERQETAERADRLERELAVCRAVMHGGRVVPVMRCHEYTANIPADAAVVQWCRFDTTGGT